MSENPASDRSAPKNLVWIDRTLPDCAWPAPLMEIA